MKDRYFESPEKALYARKCAECGGYAKIGSPLVKLKGTSAFHSHDPIFGALCNWCHRMRHEAWEDLGMITLPKRVSAGKE